MDKNIIFHPVQNALCHITGDPAIEKADLLLWETGHVVQQKVVMKFPVIGNAVTYKANSISRGENWGIQRLSHRIAPLNQGN